MSTFATLKRRRPARTTSAFGGGSLTNQFAADIRSLDLPRLVREERLMEDGRACVCDKRVFPDCPGHKPPYLSCTRSISRPSLQTMRQSKARAHEVRTVLRFLRPRDTEDMVERRMVVRSPWRADASYHGVAWGSTPTARIAAPTQRSRTRPAKPARPVWRPGGQQRTPPPATHSPHTATPPRPLPPFAEAVAQARPPAEYEQAAGQIRAVASQIRAGLPPALAPRIATSVVVGDAPQLATRRPPSPLPHEAALRIAEALAGVPHEPGGPPGGGLARDRVQRLAMQLEAIRKLDPRVYELTLLDIEQVH